MSVDAQTVGAFSSLYRGRTDVWGGIEGRANKQPVTEANYRAHLEAKVSLGVYMLLDNGECHFAAVDIDEKAFDKALAIKNELKKLGIWAYISQSRSKGFHVTMYAETKFVAEDIRRVLGHVLQQLNIKAEIFPKQDKLDKTTPYGNYINLPCFGYDRPFLTDDQKPLTPVQAIKLIKRTPEQAVINAAKAIPPTAPPAPTSPPAKSKRGAKPKHPPCIIEILKGVQQGVRDEAAFALARHYLDMQYTEDEVMALLLEWDRKNKPPFNDPKQLETKLRSAQKGYAFGCSSIKNGLLSPMCCGENNCVWLQEGIREKKKRGLIKETTFLETDEYLLEELSNGTEALFLQYHKPTGVIEKRTSFDIGEVTWVPVMGSEITEGAVILPNGIEEYGDTLTLVNDIRQHIHKFVDMPPAKEEFAAWYVLMTWVADRLRTVGYYRFAGDTGTGKSRALDVVGRLCYKPMVLAGAITPAPIYRLIRRFRGTLVLDEADFADSSEKSEVITILNCLTPLTRVVTPDGTKAISEIQLGQQVLGHSGQFKAVTRLFKREYNGELVKITPAYSNLPIEMTPEHPVMVKGGTWVAANALHSNDCLAIPKPQLPDKDIESLSFPVKWPLSEKAVSRSKGRWSRKKEITLSIPFNEDIAWMLGFYIAEGCPHTGNYITFTVNRSETSNIERLVRIFRENFNYTPSFSFQNETCHICVCISGLGQFFSKWFGSKAYEKRIPEELIRLPKAKLTALIRGILDGDGHQQPEQGHIQLTTSSENLVWSLRLALGRLNILAGVYFNGKSHNLIQGRTVKTHNRWQVRISAADASKLGYETRRRHFQQVTQDDQFWYIHINKIEHSPYTGTVYNLAVADDESYSLINLHCHNCGFERGRPIVRCSKDDPNTLEILPCFGPKVFATRYSFDDVALEARCITTKMEETERDDILSILDDTFFNEEMKLRNKLLLWRFHNYMKVEYNSIRDINLDLGKKRLEPRMKQTSLPYALMFKDQPEVLDRFREFIHRYQDELIETRAEGEQGRIIYALFSLAAEHGKNYVSSGMITAYVNEHFKLDITAQRVGKILTSLNLPTVKKRFQGKHAHYISWNPMTMRKLNRRYMVDKNEFASLFEDDPDFNESESESELGDLEV